MKPERIFIAGPYQPKDCSLHQASQIAQHNVDQNIKVANALIEKGHFVFAPLLSHYIHVHSSCKKDYYEWWYDEDNTFLDHWATAIIMTEGWDKSYGACKEHKRAKKLGLKIYYGIEEVEDCRT